MKYTNFEIIIVLNFGYFFCSITTKESETNKFILERRWRGVGPLFTRHEHIRANFLLDPYYMQI